MSKVVREAESDTNRGSWPRFSARGKVLLALLGGIMILRETGVLGLNVYVSSAKWRTENQSSAPTSFLDLESSASRSADSASRVIVSGDSDLTERVGDSLRDALRDELHAIDGRLTVEITKIDMSGVYLLPIFKFAAVEFECFYEVRTPSDGDHPRQRGKAQGTVDSQVRGFCSVHKFRELAAATVSKAIQNQVRDMLRKRV